MNYVTYINRSGKTVLEYNTDGSYILNLPIILTQSKKLIKNMPYLLMEGNHIFAVKLLNVRHAYGTVYIEIKELRTDKIFTLSWDMNFEGDCWLWTLADLETLMNMSE